MNTIKLQSMLKQFFNEDIGDGDLSSETIFSPTEQGSITFYAKEDGIFCGVPIIETGFKLLDPQLKITILKKMAISLLLVRKLPLLRAPFVAY